MLHRPVQEVGKIMNRLILMLASVLAVAGCGNASTPSDAQQAAAVLSGDSKGAASDNPLCKLFSADELSAYSGPKLGPGASAAMGSGCKWDSSDDSVWAMIQILPLDYAANPSNAPGYRAAPEVGTGGYVLPEYDGWSAGASSDKEFIAVQVNGPKASDATAIALLKEVMRRRQ
jgi:hypothetical protein